MLQLCSLPAAVAIEGRDDEEGMRRDGNRTQAWAQFIYLHKVNDVEGNSCAFNRCKYSYKYIIYVCAVYEYVHNVNALGSGGSTRCVYLMCRHFAYLYVCCWLSLSLFLYCMQICYSTDRVVIGTHKSGQIHWIWLYAEDDVIVGAGRARLLGLGLAWLGLLSFGLVWATLRRMGPISAEWTRITYTHTHACTQGTHRHTSAQ